MGNVTGKKGKQASKAGTAAVKQCPGKARREQAAALRSVEARLDALVAKLGEELEDKKSAFSPPAEQERTVQCALC